MGNKRFYIWKIASILIFLLIYGMTSVLAVEIPNLMGPWTVVDFQKYTPTEGFGNETVYPVSYQFTDQDGQAFVGFQSFYDPEFSQNMTEVFSGVFSPDGLTFEIDNEGNGISFGETVSDHELYLYTLLPERGPMILSFHLLKDGTIISPSEQVTDVVGPWNLTHNRKNSVTTSGLLTIEEQQDRIWIGAEHIQDEDGSMIDMPIAGTIGDDGKLYATTRNGAYMFGTQNGNDSIQSVLIIPGDTDGTYVIDRSITKNGVLLPESDIVYPDIEGDWKIDNRKVIQDGEISDTGTSSDEWLSVTNQNGKFFSVVRYNQTVKTSDNEKTGMFYGTHEAIVTGADNSIELYHVIDNSSIQAIVNRKDNMASLYLDMLSPKEE